LFDGSARLNFPMKLFVSSLFFLAIFSLFQTAAAAPKPADLAEAKIQFTQGETEYRLGNFERALVHFRAALARVRRPSIQLNIAQCHRQMGQHEKALFGYRVYLADSRRSNPGEKIPYEAEVKRYIADLEAVIAARKPRPTLLPEDQPAALPVGSQNDLAGGTVNEPSEAKRKQEYQRRTTWAYVTLAGGIAAALAGGVLIAVGAERSNNAYNEYLETRDPENIDQKWDEVEEQKKLTVAGYATASFGVAILAFSTYLFLSRPSLKEKAPVVLGIDTTGATLLWRGAF
jgi:tetratricopeptide (TPR) repeat protein